MKGEYDVVDFRHPREAKYIAEFIGTFFLVFVIGCNIHTGSIAAAISIGTALMVMVFALGTVSGAHFNPAVTLSVLLSGRNKISMQDAFFYMVFQCMGGIVGGFTYMMLVRDAFLLAPAGKYSVGLLCHWRSSTPLRSAMWC